MTYYQYLFSNLWKLRDKKFKELEYEIRCNNCMWTGYEEDLVMYNETSKVDNTTLEFFKGCPNCKTNECLINI